VNILLDTCAFLWAMDETDRLSQTAVSAFNDTENRVFLSAASVWEICVKFRLGQLGFPEPPGVFIPKARREYRISSLPLVEQAALMVQSLPPRHRDPFDRMLVCQAMFHNLTILTPDPLIHQYGVECLW
jgi:PIN domain nuclease of toxin-antitoxin system